MKLAGASSFIAEQGAPADRLLSALAEQRLSSTLDVSTFVKRDPCYSDLAPVP